MLGRSGVHQEQLYKLTGRKKLHAVGRSMTGHWEDRGLEIQYTYLYLGSLEGRFNMFIVTFGMEHMTANAHLIGYPSGNQPVGERGFAIG